MLLFLIENTILSMKILRKLFRFRLRLSGNHFETNLKYYRKFWKKQLLEIYFGKNGTVKWVDKVVYFELCIRRNNMKCTMLMNN